MVIRSRQLAFAGGAAVFPGGRVDEADRKLAARLEDARDVEDIAARITAIRETLEETGLALGLARPVSASQAAQARNLLDSGQSMAEILQRFGWELDIDALFPFARWRPPDLARTRIFDTRFYLADLGTGAVEVAVDRTENTHLFWTSAHNALAMADRGEISVIFPTRRNLERLAQFASFVELRDHALSTPVEMISPWIDETGERPMLRIPDGLGYPVTGEPLETTKTEFKKR